MLRLSVHAGGLDEVSRFNRLDWLDIGYEKLDAVADYKVVLFRYGIGATPEHRIANYPRWSASLWDLVARAIAICLHPQELAPIEEICPVVPPEDNKAPAYALAVTAVLEHFASYGPAGGRRIGSIEVVRHGKGRNLYHAVVREDLQNSRSTLPFTFSPAFLRPVELVLHAALLRLTGGTKALPPRPPLLLPAKLAVGDVQCIEISRLAEPARTGFQRWLFQGGAPAVKGVPEGFAPEAHFAKFIAEAV